jgi:aspartate/methionine/tyrosine aminotransferase
LRESIAAWQHENYGVNVSPDQIVVTSGCSAAMMLSFAAILDPGNRVLLTDPGYPCYPKFVEAFEGTPTLIPVKEGDGFQFPLDRLERALKQGARAVVLNSPSNPAGTLASQEQMLALADLAAGRAIILSDEIYHGLVYRERAHSILEFTRESIVINGFSKLFAMTGWRLGYAILPPELVRPVQKLQQNLFISAADFTQIAAITALTQAHSEVEEMRREYDRRRRLVLGRLAEMGLQTPVEPTGAFYVLVNVSRFTDDVYNFAFQILEEVGVAVTPGVDFGRNGEGYIRICYANSMSNLREAMDRLSQFFSTNLNSTELA